MNEHLQYLLSLIPNLQDQPAAISPLEGGLTNQNYRLEVGDEVFVLRLGGADTDLLGIHRDREVACARLAAAAAIGPDVIAYLPDQQAILTRFVPGRLLTAACAREPDILRRVAATLRCCHECRAATDLGAFSAFATIRHYHALARQKSVPLPADLDRALAILAALEATLTATEPPCLCHNDLLPNNCIDTGDSIYLIDWEYAGLGDRFFDLGNLAVNFQLAPEAEVAFLEYYFGETRSEDLRRMRLMRRVSDLREALWGYLQAGISRLFTPQYYLEYGRKHLDRFLAATDKGA